MPPLFLLNTETRKLEEFKPLHKGKVSMYTCGPTVYDYVHIGNIRAYLVADILKRVLMTFGYQVNHTMNLTDFGHLTDDGDAGEDKMIKAIKRDDLPISIASMKSVAEKYIEAFYEDIDEVNIIPPNTWTRATDYVTAQIRLIETLAGKGYTYETNDGVYFDISKFPTYGALGNIDLNKLKEGARVEINKEKKHPADFAVWKKSELGWDSSWGKGFPGWHIECSAMAISTLGNQIDIHTGGEDLMYTHHNAEIAQSEAATGKKFVNYWLHSAFLTIDNTKISKSLGNSITLRQLLDNGYAGEDYRYWLLTAHYRSQISFTYEALDGARTALSKLKRLMFEEYKKRSGKPDQSMLEKFYSALANDLDTPTAISLLWETVKNDDLDVKTKVATLLKMDEVLDIGLSIDLDEGLSLLGVVDKKDIPEDIQALIDKREVARIAHNWVEADTLRDALSLKGYTVEDTPRGPRVSKI